MCVHSGEGVDTCTVEGEGREGCSRTPSPSLCRSYRWPNLSQTWNIHLWMNGNVSVCLLTTNTMPLCCFFPLDIDDCLTHYIYFIDLIFSVAIRIYSHYLDQYLLCSRYSTILNEFLYEYYTHVYLCQLNVLRLYFPPMLSSSYCFYNFLVNRSS